MISPKFRPQLQWFCLLVRLRKVVPEAVTIAAVAIAQLTGALQFWEWAVFDTLLRLRPAEPMDQRVVIIGLTEADIRQAQTYPLPDRTLARLLKILQAHQPAVIGLDIVRDLPVEPGHAELVQIFRSSPNLIAIEKVVPPTVNPPPGVAAQNLGFADAKLDDDGKLRRSLLANLADSGSTQLSLAVRLAAVYLKPQGFDLNNGVQDPKAMRFGKTELPRFQPNSGGYVRADAGGTQTLINFRRGAHPFPVLTLPDLQRGVDSSRLRGKIVLIGMMAPSVKDTVATSAIVTENAALVYGVEVQAHAVSQIVSGALDGRPLLNVWWDGWDYVWIGVWGIIGIVLGRSIRSPLRSFLALALAGFCLVSGSYGLLILGWWIPVVPAVLALMVNGVGLSAFYRYDEALRSRLHDRQLTIDQTFNAIHNGPLQSLGLLLRAMQETELPQSQLLERLRHLNQELRDVYEVVQREVADPVLVGQQQQVNLQRALHELLHEVYTTVLERDFPGFATLKFRVVKFDPLNDRHLSPDQKHGLCRFLEEALCNVGKHAIDPTRLEILCTQSEGQNRIRVTDNGKGRVADLPTEAIGMGTQQAGKLAKQLGGTFRRWANENCGISCELTWPGRRMGGLRF